MERYKLQRIRNEPNDMDDYGFDPIDVLSIDLNNLDQEAKDHPKWMGRFTKIYRRKYEQMRKEELKLEIVEDECAEAVRENPEKYGIKKGHRLTDSLINRTIKRHFIKYRNQHEATYRAKAEEKEWDRHITSLVKKGEDIKIAAELWARNYFDLVVREKREKR